MRQLDQTRDDGNFHNSDPHFRTLRMPIRPDLHMKIGDEIHRMGNSIPPPNREALRSLLPAQNAAQLLA